MLDYTCARYKFRIVLYCMGNRLVAGKPPHYLTKPDQLSLLPSVGREMITGQSAVMFCGWE